MSDTQEPTPSFAPPDGAGTHELAVDLAAFLPDGVALGEPDPAADPERSAEPPAPEPPADERPVVDVDALAQVERDLDAVDAAIAALDAGTYGIDPATGRPIADHLLAEDPTRLS